jgi:hypothetical protein
MITSSQQLTRSAGSRTKAARKPSKNYRRDHGHSADQPLKPWQIVNLCKLAKEVWDYLIRNDAIEIPSGVSKTAAFEQWRKQQQRLVFADWRESLKDAMQRDVRSLKAHYWSYLPAKTAAAYDQAATSSTKDEARRQALWYMDKELAYQKKNRAYADELARDKFGKGLQHLTAEQIFKGVLATLRHRRQTTAEQDAAQDAAVAGGSDAGDPGSPSRATTEETNQPY